jgi:hypothetical protein
MKITWLKTENDIEGDTFYQLCIFDLKKLKLRKTNFYKSLDIIFAISNSILTNWPINIIVNWSYYHEDGVYRKYIVLCFDPVEWTFEDFNFPDKKDLEKFILKSSYAAYPKQEVEMISSYLTSF